MMENILKFQSKLLGASLFFVAMSASVSAVAGPAVTITVKNLDPVNAAQNVATSTNEISTIGWSSPKPVATIPASSQDLFKVQSTISPLANYATLRYKIGAKECIFDTTFTTTFSGGAQLPKWNQTAIPSGGAVCTATRTSTNIATNEWAVTFTIK